MLALLWIQYTECNTGNICSPCWPGTHSVVQEWLKLKKSTGLTLQSPGTKGVHHQTWLVQLFLVNFQKWHKFLHTLDNHFWGIAYLSFFSFIWKSMHSIQCIYENLKYIQFNKRNSERQILLANILLYFFYLDYFIFLSPLFIDHRELISSKFLDFSSLLIFCCDEQILMPNNSF